MRSVKKILFIFFLVYSVFGFFILPSIIKSQLIKNVDANLNVTLNIQKVSFNPYFFKLGIFGIDLKDKQKKKLLSSDALKIDLEFYSLLRGVVHIKSLLLEKPKVFVTYNKDKTLNLLSIVKQKDEQSSEHKKQSTPPRVILDTIVIEDGMIAYSDLSKKSVFDIALESIGFKLQDIDTKDLNQSDAKLRFHTMLGDGGFFDLKSTLLSLKPFKAEGSVDFEASKIYTQWRYLKDMLNLEVADGKISFGAKYAFSLDDLSQTKIYNIHSFLSKLRIKPKNEGRDILNLTSLKVDGGTFLPFQNRGHLRQISLNSFDMKVKRDTNGTIDWTNYLKVETAKKQSGTKELNDSDSKPFDFTVDDIALKNIKLSFEDSFVSPHVTTRVNELNVSLKNFNTLGSKPLDYAVRLNANDALKCDLNGDFLQELFRLNTKFVCSSFNIVHYKPYMEQFAKTVLKRNSLDLQQAVLGFDLNATLSKEGQNFIPMVENADIVLEHLLVAKKKTHENLAALRSFSVNGIKLDGNTREIYIKNTQLDQLSLYGAKYRNKRFNFENIIVPKNVTTQGKGIRAEKGDRAYHLYLEHFGIKGSKAVFKDASLNPATQNKIDNIAIDLYNIDSDANKSFSYTFKANVNDKGEVDAKGDLQHTPLEQKGSIDIQKISLEKLTPYLREKTYASIDDGYISLHAKESYRHSLKKPDLQMEGSFGLDELFVSDYRDKVSLFSLNKLLLKSFSFNLFPNSLSVKEMNLNGFYLNALIDKDKSFNLASLQKKRNTEKTKQAKKTQKKASEPFEVMVTKLNVANGSARFADMSLPLKFQTDIHDLNGVAYALSNKKSDTSYLDMNGVVDEYGVAKIEGSLNAGNPKSYTDIHLNFGNLNLSSMSGYSASFAGYKIDEGKLFLDLGYKIENSKLQGSNDIMIKKIKLGERIEDENITHLPLGLAIALLEDTDGVMDISMPVEGNIDSPDFKYGTLVWKTLGNLVVKAVASPFQFLGSMLGIDGEDLKYADFAFGKTLITPPTKEKFDNIAKILFKRPKLILEIVPVYDALQDKEALQKQKLLKLVKEYDSDEETLMNVSILEKIYEKAKPEKTLDKLKEELAKKYEAEMLQREYRKALVSSCAAMQKVSDAELISLADIRAEQIREYLTKTKFVSPSRIVVQKPLRSVSEDPKWAKIKLKVNIK